MRRAVQFAGAVLALALCGAAAVHEWRDQVPVRDRVALNPYSSDREVLAAGERVFAERCANCHGSAGIGRGRRPSLQTERIRAATDGELLWLLKNGELRYGMPSWSALPEQQRWQVELYVKSIAAGVDTR